MTGAADDFVGFFDILPDSVRQAQIDQAYGCIFVCDANLCWDRYQIKVHHIASLKLRIYAGTDGYKILVSYRVLGGKTIDRRKIKVN